MANLLNKNITVNGRRTSIRLEPEMWEALTEICCREGLTMHELCSLISAKRLCGTLTADVRIYILSYYRKAATEDGHARIGHGRTHEPQLAIVS